LNETRVSEREEEETRVIETFVFFILSLDGRITSVPTCSET